jgi:gamma-glutamyltranspeptidase/glutathione hydrolase
MKKLLLALAVLVYSPVASAQGVVTSADPRATQAGQQILREGGSAADAAMAMMLALTVVEPQSSGIGGGGFLIHHDGKTGKLDTIDGREKAPAAATPERFLGADGKPMPFGQAFQGGKSVGVPGNIRLMALTHQKWGKLPWKALFAPAIKLAEDGYQVSKPLNDRISGMARIWDKFPEIAKQYTVGGQVPAMGSTMKNPALAAILRRIADEGPEAFYAGDNARAIVAAATGTTVNTSDMTAADLTAYQAKERPPVCGFYRTYKICGMGPPSSGAVTVLEILGMLKRFDLKKMGPNSPVAWHLIGEAMELAYADREKYLGDTDFVQVPVKGMIDPAYLAARSKLISTTATLPAYEAGTPPGAQARTAVVQNEVHGTTHFIAVDRNGDIVSMTSTVEGPFGSQLMANGYVLNNELTDFSAAPEKDGAPVANRVQGGKRPLSSMAPTIVYDAKGKPIFTVGAAGGKTIIMQVAKALIAHLDWGMSAQDSIGHGLIYFSGRTLILEKGTALEPMKEPLEKLGHQVVISSLGLKANAAERTATGWVGAADPRSVGTALSDLP